MLFKFVAVAVYSLPLLTVAIVPLEFVAVAVVTACQETEAFMN